MTHGPVGVDMQQLRPSSNTQLTIVFNKSNLPKVQFIEKPY